MVLKPIVEKASLEEDLYRRDFTINAKAIQLNSENLGNSVKEALESNGPIICRVNVSSNQVTAPRVMSRQTKNGNMETAPMENMWPEIDLEDL